MNLKGIYRVGEAIVKNYPMYVRTGKILARAIHCKALLYSRERN